MKIFLTDNGSLRPAAVYSLRRLAGELSEQVGIPIFPASLLHTNRIPDGQLEGGSAPILEEQLFRWANEGECSFGVIPLFFGPSRALSEYIPAVESRLRKRWPELNITVGRPLVDESDADSVAKVGSLLAEGIRRVVPTDGPPPHVYLVDHGTPEIGVNRIRELLGEYLRENLAVPFASLRTVAMERRDGPEYAFNDPLLETVLREKENSLEPIVISLLFLQPGRHAGPGGDIVQICEDALSPAREGTLIFTPLVGEIPDLVPLLAERVREIQKEIRPGCPTR